MDPLPVIFSQYSLTRTHTYTHTLQLSFDAISVPQPSPICVHNNPFSFCLSLLPISYFLVSICPQPCVPRQSFALSPPRCRAAPLCVHYHGDVDQSMQAALRLSSALCLLVATWLFRQTRVSVFTPQ